MLKDETYHNNLHNETDLKENIHNKLSSVQPAELSVARVYHLKETFPAPSLNVVSNI